MLAPLTRLLRERGLTICAAESCTGGLVCAALTDVSRSSEYFIGGMVTYANAAKVDHLGVQPETLESAGAVSREVAGEMVVGVLRRFGADVAISVTGIAGPDAEGGKPVGLTFIGVAFQDRVEVRQYNWTGGRASNRAASVEAAFAQAVDILSEPYHKRV